MRLATPHRMMAVCIALTVIGIPVPGEDLTAEHGLKSPKPGPWALKLCTNPILQKARRVDLRFAEPQEASQKEAERLYLEFVDKFPDHPLVPYIYYRLGHMYTDYVSQDLAKRGAVWDSGRALVYFRKVVDLYEAGGSLDYVIEARVNVAALAPKREDKVSEYIAYYKWLCELETSARKDVTDGLLRTIRGQKQVAAANMVGIAYGNQHSIRPDLLNQIANALPGQEPGDLALARLNEGKAE